jgi:hypothetical protein
MNKDRQEMNALLDEIIKSATNLREELNWLCNLAQDPKSRNGDFGYYGGAPGGSHSDPTADSVTDPYCQRVRKLYKKAMKSTNKALDELKFAETAARIAIGANGPLPATPVIDPRDRLPKAELRSIYEKQAQRHASGEGYGES